MAILLCKLIVSKLHSVQTKDEILQQFRNAFEGLGNLGEEFDIKLTPDAQPFALTTPPNITLPLRPKVAQELARMGLMGVISSVQASQALTQEEPSWCWIEHSSYETD